jgi:hypothetical protein
VTAQGLSRVAGGVAIVAVLVVTGLVTWSYMNRSEHEFIPSQAGGPALGDLTGYVGRVDREARTIDVSESLLGIRPTLLTVTSDTSILVRGKQGGIGDLSKDMPVRVFYEVRNDVKYVTSLQVMTEDTQTARSAADEAKPAAEAKAPAESSAQVDAKPVVASKPPTETKPATEAKVPAEAKPPVESKPAVAAKPPAETKPPVEAKPAVAAKPPAEAKPPVVATTPAEKPPLEAKAPAVTRTPAPPVTATAPRAAAPPIAAAPARPTPTPQPATAQAAAPAAARPATSGSEAASIGVARTPLPTVRPAERDADDATAAIDWLLKRQ